MKYRGLRTKTGKFEKENWKLCHEIVALRDGLRCVVCGTTEDLALDHCFTRECLILHFEPLNLSYLCGQHHQNKTFRKGGYIDHVVKEICRKRNPEWYTWALTQAMKTCGQFHTVHYQELINLTLKTSLKNLVEELILKEENK